MTLRRRNAKSKYGGKKMLQEDAEKLLIRWLRERPRSDYSNYGYDVCISNVIRWHLVSLALDQHSPEYNRLLVDLSPSFYSAAWELCRRGIIRPGVKRLGDQVTDPGSGGDGYSITPFGDQWIAESDKDDFVPTEPQRFAQMLQPYHDRFGSGFYERAQEAVRCYGAHAYLACCAMCGAAAESILLAAAIGQRDEESVMKTYASAQGRSRVQQSLLAHVIEPIRREFNNLSVLLKYWRDEAAHGVASGIADNEAYTSLALLLRLAQFVNQYWGEITASA